MPNVALIQDGTEVARQRFADVGETFERCRAMLCEDGYTNFSFTVFMDEEVDLLLDGIDPNNWACLVFASNALRSEEVASALERRANDLRAYVTAAGGIVILHQIVDSLDSVLPADLAPLIVERGSDSASGPARAIDDRDVLLRYPFPVEWACMRDLTGEELQLLRSAQPTSELTRHFFTHLREDALPPKLTALLRAPGGEILLARTGDHVRERVVVSTMPLDWQGSRPGQETATVGLLANAIRYASLGTPRRLVWRDPASTRNELLRRWLCLDGATAIRLAPDSGDDIDDVDSWLLGTVDVLFLPPEHIDSGSITHDVRRFLEGGGTVITVAKSQDFAASHITALVGRYEERELASNVYAELRALPGWRTPDSAFRLRNILAVLAYFAKDAENRRSVALEPSDLRDDLEAEVTKRLCDPRHREDFGSSLALIQTMAYMVAPERVDDEVTAWVEKEAKYREFDVVLQARATLALAWRTVDTQFLPDACDALNARYDDLSSLAPVVRLLDAIAMLHQDDLLRADEASAIAFTTFVCDALDRTPALAERGWISVEATADVVRGLVALREYLPVSDPVVNEMRARLASHVATGATALRTARHRYERNATGVAWLARLTHALVSSEQQFPIGLQRVASLDWPDVPGAAEATRQTAVLLEHLAIENEKARDSNRELTHRVEELETRRDGERLAVRLGRATATLVPTFVLIAAACAVVATIGWDSPGNFVANVTLLFSALLTLLAGAYGLLARRDLLAAPAARIRSWMQESADPIIQSVGKLRFRDRS